MLEKYYIRPSTIDRIHESWIASTVEQYVGWMAERRYTDRSVSRRIPIVVSFGEFAKAQGAREVKNLPDHVEPFVQAWIGEHARRRSGRRRKQIANEVRNPIRQMLKLAVSGYIGRGRPHKPDNPFERQAPGLLKYLPKRRGFVRDRYTSTNLVCVSSQPILSASASTTSQSCRQSCSAGSLPNTPRHEFLGRRCAMHAGCYGSFCATSIVRGVWPRISVRLSSFRSRTGTLVFRDRSVGNRSSKCWQVSTDGPPPASATTQ